MSDYEVPGTVRIFRGIGIVFFFIVPSVAFFSVPANSILEVSLIKAGLGSLVGFLIAAFFFGIAEVLLHLAAISYNIERQVDNRVHMQMAESLITIEEKIETAVAPIQESLEKSLHEAKSIRADLQSIKDGPLAQLNWLPHIAAEKKIP